ncbi:hypothetical protein AAOGI_24340 [Agarivorans albus]
MFVVHQAVLSDDTKFKNSTKNYLIKNVSSPVSSSADELRITKINTSLQINPY